MRNLIVRLGITVGIVLVMLTWTFAQAQKRKPLLKPTYIAKAFWSETNAWKPVMKKSEIDSLLQLPLLAKDTAGNPLEIKGFTITYINVDVYEDTNGKLKIMSDYYSYPVIGNKLSDEWLNYFKERTKYGDTLILEEIKTNFQPKAKLKPGTVVSYYAKPIRIAVDE